MLFKSIEFLVFAPLVVDDSVRSGSTLLTVREMISAAGLPHRIGYDAVYVSPEVMERQDVEHFGEVVSSACVFEWNVPDNPYVGSMCGDIDGVLCHNRPRKVKDGLEGNRLFLQNASPRYIPSRDIG